MYELQVRSGHRARAGRNRFQPNRSGQDGESEPLISMVPSIDPTAAAGDVKAVVSIEIVPAASDTAARSVNEESFE